MVFNTKLLEILICPIGKDKLVYDPENKGLFSKKSKLVYKIENGVPILIPDQARKID